MLIPLILLLPLVVLVLVVGWSLANGISPTPSSQKQAREILRAVPPDFSGKVYDLGSGLGTLAIFLARQLPNSKITGIENSVLPYMVSRSLLLIMHSTNLEFRYANFMTHRIADADLVVCYLYPGGMRKLKSKFEAELKPGTIVISNTFALEGWQPAQTLRASDMYRSPIYVYVAP